MVWAHRLWLKVQGLFRRDRSSQRLNAEIQFHLDQQVAENLAAGMSPQEARQAAMRTFGNPTFLKEETRETWGWTWLEQLARLDKGCTLAWANRGWIHADRHLRSEAEKDWQSAIRSDPNHAAPRELARLLEGRKLGKFPLNYSF